MCDRNQSARIQLSYGMVMGLNGASEAIAILLNVSAETAQTIVEFFSQRADLLRVARKLFLVPSISDGLEQRNEGCRRSRYDTALDSVFDQARILLQGSAKKSFSWQKHDYTLRI